MSDNKNSASSSRKEYVSLLNVLAITAVVFLHTNGCFWLYSEDRYWKTADLIESCFYFAVPVFFSITGITLLDYRKKYTTEVYFKKRVAKILLPFLFWSLVALAYSILKGDINIHDISPIMLIDGILNAKFLTIYWFYKPLIIAYLCIPLFSAVQSERKKVFKYIALIGFVLNILIPFVISVFGIKLEWGYRIDVIAGYLFWVIVGYLIDNEEISRIVRYIIYALSIAGLLMHMIGTYVLSSKAGAVISTYKGYNNLPAVLYSIGIIVFIKYNAHHVMENEKIGNLVNGLSKYSYGIFLIHWYALEFVRIIIFQKVFGINYFSIIYRLTAPILIIPICVIVIWLIRKVPFVKHLIP